MLKSFNSPPDDRNGHLRNLLDQRSARADVHGRLSAAVSDFSDTTSVYSHSYFSPRLSDIGESRVGHAYSSPVSDERDETQTSILDLTDDQRTSYVSQDYENTNATSEEVTDESEIIARMSYLGPKMRVHSRAPWEEEGLEEVDEEDFRGSLSFSRQPLTKNVAPAFSSPSGSVSRQSEDSSISQLATRQSFETINSQGSLSQTRTGLDALAQESISSSSLGRRTPVKEGFLHKLSIGRLRSETSNMTIVPNVPPMPSPVSSLAPTGAIREWSPIKTRSVSSASSSHESLELLSARKASTHPYANPDLVVSYPEEIKDASTHSDAHYTLPHSNSKVTVTMADSSANCLAPKVRMSPISTKSISSPVSVISSLQNVHAGGAECSFPGWTERSSTAPFALISLEEARAKRMRTSTDTGAATLPSSESSMPFLGNSTNHSTSSSSSPLANLGSRARGRSISAGANAKITLHQILGQTKSERQITEPTLKEEFTSSPSGKTLKNKKSGFMRIFNRDKDLQSVPPVPSMPDGINQLQPSRHLAADSIYRAPVPSLSQSEIAVSQSGGSLQAGNLNQGMKRSSPSLSINTTTQGSSRGHTPRQPYSTLVVPSPGPQSAPANLPEFPVLNLRPVSMLFSASFGDLVPSDPSITAVQETPRSDSPTSSRSPLTIPISPSRPTTSVINGDSHSAVKALQEQMISSKNAWERHIWELESQVRDLKAELEQLKGDDEYCDKCGRGKKPPQDAAGTINRPRARTGTSSSRFASSRA